MRRVVITGLGAASTMGLTLKEIEATLRSGKSCITFCPDYETHGFKSRVAGWIHDWDATQFLDRKAIKMMGRASEFACYAAMEAMKDSRLKETDVQNDRCGCIVGCGAGSPHDMFEAAYAMEAHNKPRRIGLRVPKTMASSRSANITMLIKNRGMSLAISDACATGLVNIGYAFQTVKWGTQDVVFAGGGESCDWACTVFFDAMGVLADKHNDNPSAASRPFDKDRAGFVMGEGGGIVIVEELQHALSRGAPIYGEILGYTTNCDGGFSMVAPSQEGQTQCMKLALQDAGLDPGDIDYINTHGTGTVTGDPSEISAIKQLFQDYNPMVTSTKSQIGHTTGAAGAIELIASLLMMKHSFIAPSINIDNPDPECDYPGIVTTGKEVEFNTFLTNNFAFGGSNATMIVKKYKG
ncbi:beta-ketoacyl-[acyl-carrier-protein] synthase family protein [candidate division KSB1 bacterium]|nr:beta-ketoacyl-[acyl-carrier-protein] synthase family protein [candidate division KSB1 bacterium]